MINLQFEDKGNYLAVHFSGPTELAQLNIAIDQVWEQCQAAKHKRVLCDLREMAKPSGEFLRYEMGVHIAQVWSGRLKGVFMVASASDSHLTENAAVNRGARIRFMSDEAEALAWLLEATRPTPTVQD